MVASRVTFPSPRVLFLTKRRAAVIFARPIVVPPSIGVEVIFGVLAKTGRDRKTGAGDALAGQR
jgi:hypothetical protein